ncbi:MAG: cysteine dioxygenase family protein [Streptosporangiaceae bacterium]
MEQEVRMMTVLTAAPTLADRARQIADRSADWLHRVRLDPSGRWYERLHSDDDHEVWIICWLPGQATGFHDHGGSAGAFVVALGTLEELSVTDDGTVRAWDLRTDDHHAFGENYIHDVRNSSSAPAISVHVYSPPLSTINRYDLTPEGELVTLLTENEEDW